MKEKTANILTILLTITLLTIPLSFIVLNTELIVGDELWNFQNIVKMINGGKMYVDCNIIITPIFYLLGYCFIKVITGTILGFRIYNIVIFLFLLLSSFILFRKLKIDKIKSLIYTLLLFVFIMPYISDGASYNVLAESIFILGIALFLNKDKIKYYNFCQGFIIFACIFTKQNIGLYYFLALIIAEFIIYKNIKDIIQELIVAVLLGTISIIIMYPAGCLKGFFNYTVFGMREFTSQNLKIQDTVGIIVIGYLLIAICSYFLAFLLSKQYKESQKEFKVLIIFSIFLNLSALPIINLYHVTFSILINVIIFIYIIEKMLLCKLDKKSVLISIAIVIYLIINSYGIFCGYKVSKNKKITNKSNVYFSSNMSYETEENLKAVSKYIQNREKDGIDVICITSDAALYMTYLNKNHGELDLCFVGNLGRQGKEGIINKIKELDENTEILINKNSYWQEINQLKEFVMNNYKNDGEIGDLIIYKNK